jgi:radical SAM protein (TIGR01212 family)
MNYPWGNSRRFNAYPDYLKSIFGSRVQKVTIDAGFTCPNRDGTRGTGGCSFCSNDAFSPSYCNPGKPVRQQIKEGIEFHQKRYKSATRYLAYFQAYSNTYKSIDELKAIYNEALNEENIAGIVMGTRPDCIDDEKLDYFRELSAKIYLVLEYGIESVYNKTLYRVNRGHTFEKTIAALEKTADRGIRTGGHMIFGLPGESREETLKSAEIISTLPLNTIKFHQLQIIRGTKMADEYLDNPGNFQLFETIDEYLEFVVKYLEQLNPAIVVERIAGETPPRFNKGIHWGTRYDQILVKLEKMLEEKDTWQGKKWEKGA